MTPNRITCVCPSCRRTYFVLTEAVGHRARCRMCGRIFRVADRTPSPPTENDVYNWLSESEEQDDAAIENSQDMSRGLVGCAGGGSKGCGMQELVNAVLIVQSISRFERGVFFGWVFFLSTKRTRLLLPS